MNQSTSYAYRSARPTDIAVQSKIAFWRGFVVTVSLLLPTFALAAFAQAQISYDNGFETQFDNGQLSFETELVQPQVIAPAYGHETGYETGYETGFETSVGTVIEGGYEIAADALPQQTYATTPQGQTVSPDYQSYNQTFTSARTSTSSSGNVQPGLAQQKAQQAAQMGLQGHLGGSLGGAKYEGVGWSNHSAQNAIHSCCYWGTRPTAQIGIAKGNNGFWYACVLYY